MNYTPVRPFQKFCSSRCSSRSRRAYAKQWVKDRGYAYQILHQAKTRAKKKGLDFTITEEDIVIPKRCPVLGIHLKRNTTSGFHNDSPSLDRIDNTQGYIKGNVRIISNRANLLKCDATIHELRLVLLDAYRGVRHRM